MSEPETKLIQSVTPRREWLVRCNDSDIDLSVCAISVSNGQIEIISPEADFITLAHSQIADFHTALHEAIEQAETDLRNRELARARA